MAKRLILDLPPASVQKVAGIVMLGTPSEGALLADGAINSPFFSDRCALLDDLKTIETNSILQDTRNRWSRFMLGSGNGFRPYVACAYEKLRTRYRTLQPPVIVVPQGRIDTNCQSIFPANADHESIATPEPGSPELNWIRRSIAKALMEHSFEADAPQIGDGIVNAHLQSAVLFDWEIIAEQNAVSALSRNNTVRAQVSTSMGDIKSCVADRDASAAPLATTSVASSRTGRLEFKLEMRGTLSAVNPQIEKLVVCETRVNYEAISSARFEGLIPIGSSNGTLLIYVDGVPVKRIFAVDRKGSVVGYVEEGAPDGVKIEDGLWYGEIRFEHLSEGLYIVKLEAASTNKLYSSGWEEASQQFSYIGELSIRGVAGN